MIWNWETINPANSVQSGDIAKLFKNEAVKQPGALAPGAPPADATLLAREAIQNSWDAGRALTNEMALAGVEAPKFKLHFVFDSIEGEAKEQLIETLGLRELAVRAGANDRKKLGLADLDCLSSLDDPSAPLRTLRIIERGTTGMFGSWQAAESRMFLAMVSIGFTEKAEGSGGSYGYGKSGLIRGSRIRTVVAHTCFEERPEDPGVTRRLLGMTYWGRHGKNTGFARFGAAMNETIVPFENAKADAVADKLALLPRDASDPRLLGTSFLLIDPAVTPDQLRQAVERNWWPAIEDSEVGFDVSIEDYDGHPQFPRPAKDKVLAPFIQAYRLALSAPDNQKSDEFRKDLGNYQPVGHERRPLGVIGIRAELGGWSYAQSAAEPDDEAADHQSLVALVRGPRMVVEYYQCGRTQPFVRGTFVAADEIDDLLRQTEPKAHDAWLPRPEEEGTDPEAPKFAKRALDDIREAVRQFRKQLKPPAPREQDIHLPLLNDLFRSLLENRGPISPPPPPADPRRVAINVEQGLEADGDAIRVRAKVNMRLTENEERDKAQCRLFVRVAFDEDGRRGDNCPLQVLDAPSGLGIEPNVDGYGTVFQGVLTHDWVTIEVLSDPYDPDWTSQLIVGGDPVDLLASSGAAS